MKNSWKRPINELREKLKAIVFFSWVRIGRGSIEKQARVLQLVRAIQIRLIVIVVAKRRNEIDVIGIKTGTCNDEASISWILRTFTTF